MLKTVAIMNPLITIGENSHFIYTKANMYLENTISHTVLFKYPLLPSLPFFLPPSPWLSVLCLFLCIAFSLNEEIGFDFGLNTYRCTALEVLSEDGEGTAFQ